MKITIFVASCDVDFDNRTHFYLNSDRISNSFTVASGVPVPPPGLGQQTGCLSHLSL